METKEFNELVEKRKNEMLSGDAYELFNSLKTQHLYRYGGIEGVSFSKMLTEIAQAEILDIEFMDNVNLEQEIANFKKQ